MAEAHDSLMQATHAYLDEGALLMLAAGPPASESWAALCGSLMDRTGRGLATSEHALAFACRYLWESASPAVVRSFLSDSEPFLEEITAVRPADLIRAADLGEQYGLRFRMAVNAAVFFRRGYAGFVSPESEYDRLPDFGRLQP